MGSTHDDKFATGESNPPPDGIAFGASPPGARPECPPGEDETIVPDQPATPDAAGQERTSVPGYTIEGVIGRGGVGVIYKARQLRLGRTVALKMVLAGYHAAPDQMDRLRTEAEAIARLNHPGIVQIHEVGTHGGLPYLCLEYCPLGSLEDYLGGIPLPPNDAAGVVEQLAQAVQAAHEARVVHRDLKPANVLLAAKEGAAPPEQEVDPERRGPPLDSLAPKITDFGLAKKLDEATRTQTGAVMGTPSYMAPEQARGLKEVGPAADVYSLGAILYECLTGRPPFRAATMLETLRQVVAVDPIPPRQFSPLCPRDLETVCLKCLQKDPARRYPSARALADDLRRFLDHRPIQARAAGALEKGAKWVRRRPALAGVVALAGAALVALPVVIAGVAFAVQESRRANEEAALRQQVEKTNGELKRTEADLRRTHQQVINKNQALQGAQRALKEQMRRAQASEHVAHENFLDAQGAVTGLVLVSERYLRDSPGLERVRTQFLRDAIRLCERFLGRKGDSPQMWLQAAQAHRLIGDLHGLLGEPDKAAGRYRASASFYEQLIREVGPPTAWRKDYRKELSDVRVSLWASLEPIDPEQAARALDEAAAGLSEEDGNPEWAALRRQSLAAILNNQGILAHLRGAPVEAEQAYTKAEGLLSVLNADGPEEPSFALERARTEVNLSALWAEKEPAKARARAERAFKRLEPLVKKYPREPAYAKEMSRAYANLGVLLGKQKPGGGEAVYRKAVATFEDLAGRFPALPAYRHSQALAELNLARSLSHREGRAGDTESAFRQARFLLTGLIAQFPTRADCREALALCCACRGEFRYRAGDPAGARGPMEEAVKVSAGLAQEKPESVEVRAALERYRGNLAALIHHQTRAAAAKEDWAAAERFARELVDLRRAGLAAAGPADRAVASEALASALLVEADLLVRSGQGPQAEKAIGEVTGLAPPGWRKTARVAGVLSRCLTAAQADKALSPEERARKTQALSTRCLSVLEAAGKAGVNDKEYVRDSEDFRPVRSHPRLGEQLRKVLKEWKPVTGPKATEESLAVVLPPPSLTVSPIVYQSPFPR